MSGEEGPAMRVRKPNPIISFFKGCISTKPKGESVKAKKPVLESKK